MEPNLIGNDRLTQLREDRRNDKIRRTSVIITMISAIVVIVFALTFCILKLLNANISNDIEHNLTTLSERQGDELDRNLNVQKTLANIGDLHNKKQMFSYLLNLLEQLNVGTEYKNISINSDFGVTITGLATDFSMLDKLKNSLKNARVSYEIKGDKRNEELFKSVEITEGATEVDKKVNFRINLEYNHDIFKFGVSEVKLKENGQP